VRRDAGVAIAGRLTMDLMNSRAKVISSMDRSGRTGRAVFLDRDGTLNRERGFVHRVADLELLDHVVDGLARIQALGFELVIATNQSGIARGYFTEAEMHAFNRALCQLLAAQGVRIADVYYCPFHPTEGIGPYRRESTLRKPQCGMLLAAAEEHQLDLRGSFVIGDKPSDVMAGQAAGCGTIWLHSGSQPPEPLEAQPDLIASDLLESAEFIERKCRRLAA
jgi:D-glycero-D-manno-heptose 1,7-bisphosphate phosphatase